MKDDNGEWIRMDGYGRGDSRAGSRGAPRPDCVPALDLGHLADKNNGLRNPVTDYEPKLSPPDTASTVSWGYHDYSTRTSQRGSDSRRPPFALHHAPEPTPHVTGRSQRPEGVPKLNLDGSDDIRPPSAKHQQASRRGPLIPPFHTHENQYSKHVEQNTRLKSSRGQRSPTGVDLERKIEAEKLAESRKREHIIHTVLTDQLSRAAISDPQQNIDDDPASQRPLFGVEQKPKIRNLHYTKVQTTTTGTEQLLANCINFNARILTRDGHFALRLLYGFYFAIDNSITVYEYRQFGKQSSALPFVVRGSYCHVTGRRKGRKFTVQDISVGSDLSFDTSRQNSLPGALTKQDVLKLRIVYVDNTAKEKFVFKGRVPYDPAEYSKGMYPALTNQEQEDNAVISEMQTSIQQRIKKRASRTLTGLAQHFSKLDPSGDGKFSREEILTALNIFHIDINQKLFNSVWLIVDQQSDGTLTFGDFRRYFFGEMNEFRNAFVRKAFQKIDANKSGTINLYETKKFFCPSSHPDVVSGKLKEEDVMEDFFDLFKNRESEISYGLFEDYHEGISLNTNTDEEFENIMKACWTL